MKLEELVAKLRVRLDDPIRVVPADQLWKTDELADYVSESVNEFARVTEYWLDVTTPAICVIPVIMGQNWAVVDDRIIRIRRAKLDLGHTTMFITDSRSADMSIGNWQSPTNVRDPSTLLFGEEEGKVFFDSIPKVDDTLRLAVVRYPLEPINADTMDDDLPLPDRFVMKLLPGARSLAYKKQDADTYDANRALSLETEFQSELTKIKHELKKKRHHPRKVVYREMG